MNFSEKVKYVRGKLYLTQRQLASELGVSFSTVNRWEANRQEPQFLFQKKFDDFCQKNGMAFLENK